MRTGLRNHRYYEGEKMPQITVYVPKELWARYQEQREYVGLPTEIFQQALRSAVTRAESQQQAARRQEERESR